MLRFAKISDTVRKHYVYEMNFETLAKSVWNKMCKIKGKNTNNTVRHLSVNNKEVTFHIISVCFQY